MCTRGVENPVLDRWILVLFAMSIPDIAVVNVFTDTWFCRTLAFLELEFRLFVFYMNSGMYVASL